MHGVHAVSLLGADGREQDVLLQISTRGVVVKSVEGQGQVLHQFAPEAVRKCVPSIARSRRPGGADCVDLIVLTSRGTRELHMRCAGGPDEVQSIVSAVAHDIVALKRESNPLSRVSRSSAGRSSAGGSAHPGTGQLPPTTSNSGSAQKAAGAGAGVATRHPTLTQESVCGILPSGGSMSMLQSARTTSHSAVMPDAILNDEPPLQSRRMATMRYVPRALQQGLQQACAAAAAAAAASNATPGAADDTPPHQQHQQPMPGLIEEEPEAGDGGGGSDSTPAVAGKRERAAWELAAEEADAALDEEEAEQQREGAGGGTGGADDVQLMGARPIGQEEGEDEEAREEEEDDDEGQQQAGGGGAGRQLPRQALSPEQQQQQADFSLQLLKQEAAASSAHKGSAASLSPQLRRLRYGVAGPNGSEDLRTSSWGTGAGGHMERVEALAEENGALRLEVQAHVEKNSQLEAQLSNMRGMLEEWARESLSTAQECVAAEASRVSAEARVSDLMRSLAKLASAEQASSAAAAAAEAAHAELQASSEAAAAQHEGELAEACAAADEMAEQVAESAEREASLQAQLDALSASVAALTQRATEAEVALTEERRGRGEDARVAEGTHRSWKQEHLVQRAELLDAQKRKAAAYECQARLEAELDALSAEHASVVADANSAAELVARLQAEVERLGGELGHYQADDGALQERLHAAMAAAADQRSSCDQALRGQQELQREVEVQRERLASVRHAARTQAQGEMQVLVAACQAELDAARAETAGVAACLADETTACAGLRDALAAGEARLAELRDTLEEAEGEKARLSGMSITAMARIQALEAERDSLAERCADAETLALSLASTRDAMEGAMQGERTTVESYATDMRSRLDDAEKRAVAKGEEARELRHALEVATKELEIARLSYARLEEEALHTERQMRTRHDGELRHAAAQLESTLSICNAAMADAEAKMEAKDALMERWRAEANGISANLELALAEHSREQELLSVDLSHAQRTVDLLQCDNDRLAHELGRLTAAVAAAATGMATGAPSPYASARSAAAVAAAASAAMCESSAVSSLRGLPGSEWQQQQHQQQHPRQQQQQQQRLASVQSSPPVSARGEHAYYAQHHAHGEQHLLKPANSAAASPRGDGLGTPMRRSVSVIVASPEMFAHM
ncbi:hypothetical protein FOA52_010894 [Chlamydomonas sp. UWO 241]|nr:hypothetical protein FOA52_010894 [Chlamydomonas sp. UWO 241]